MSQFEASLDCSGVPVPPPAQPLEAITDHIRASLGYLDLRYDEYFVTGGANLVIRGLRNFAKDLDLVVNDETFEWMSEHPDASKQSPVPQISDRGKNNDTVWLYNSWTPIPISATTGFPDGDYPINFESHKDKTELVGEITLLKLDEVAAIKKHLARYRDLADLKHIERPVSRFEYNPQLRNVARSTSDVKANAERMRSLIQDRN